MATPKVAGKTSTNKTCKQIAEIVYGYLNNKLGSGVKRDFERHLRACPDCVAFLRTYQRTVAATKAVRVDDLPANVRANILAFLRKRVPSVSTFLLAALGEALTHYGLLLRFITG